MASKRMFNLKIIDTDLFLDMSTSARLLYYDLNMRADDDGFVASPKKIQRMIGASDDDFKMLMAKQFIIAFNTGICVIRHWKVNNYIQKDRYTPTFYKKELAQLIENDGTYEVLDTECVHDGYIMDTQVRLGKVRLDNNIVLKEIEDCSYPNKKEIENDIIEVRKLYQGTKSKAAADLKIPPLLKKYSKDELIRGIERYNKYVKAERKTGFKDLKFKNEKTYWNGGYVDYLDENFITDINKAIKPKMEIEVKNYG